MCGYICALRKQGKQLTKLDHSNFMNGLKSLTSRGPSSSGEISIGNIWMGHRLLRILDCDLSNQPFISWCKRYIIIFNGQIYNFKELRSELSKEGSQFYSQSDAEVIIEIYRRYSFKGFKLLNGMFSFSIYDLIEDKVIFARDRFGIKPLYYFLNSENTLYIGSTIKAVKYSSGKKNWSINDEAITEFLFTSVSYDNKTAYSGISTLEAGCCAVVNRDRIMNIFPFVKDSEKLFSENGEKTICPKETWELFNESVQLMTKSKRSYLSYLSGGLDSSLICSALKTICPDSFERTFTCSYKLGDILFKNENSFDESYYSDIVSNYLGVHNTKVIVTPLDYVSNIVDAIATQEEPKGNPFFPHYQLAKLSSVDGEVVFSGEGADELFGGYTWKLGILDFEAPHADLTSLYFNNLSTLSNDIKHSEKWSSALNERSNLAFENFAKKFQSTSDLGINRIMNYDIEVFLQYLLTQSDKMHGRFGMEGRFPFLENALSSKILQTDPSVRMRCIKEGKWLLKRMSNGILPDAIVHRKKMGFVAPEGSFYASGFKSIIKCLLLEPKSFVASVLPIDYLKKIIELHINLSHDYRKFLWMLLQLEIFYQLNFNNISSDMLKIMIINKSTISKSNDKWIC